MLIERSSARCLAAVVATPDLLGRDTRDHAALLTRAERERAASIRQRGARDDFVAAHALVRHVAAALTDIPAERLTLIQRCTRCGGAHGAPQLVERPALRISLSHAGGIVAAAASWSPVGIDLLRWDDGWRLAEIDVTPRLWRRRECLVKLGLAELDDPPPNALPPGWVETEQALASMRVSASVVSQHAACFEAL